MGPMASLCLRGITPPTATPTHTPTPTPTPTGTLTGTVVDALTGDPIVGAIVRVLHTDLSHLSDENGAFTIAGVPLGDQTVESAAPSYLTRTDTMTVVAGTNPSLSISLVPSEIRIVLTWSGAPPDLDPHLTQPMCGTTDRLHVSFRGPPPGGEPGDPETLFIHMVGGVWVPGEYDVWVHNRSGYPDFGVSEAVVALFRGQSLIAEYAVSDEPDAAATTLDIWRVVNIMLDQDGTVSLDRQGHGFLDDPLGSATVPEPVTEPYAPVCS